MGEDCAATLFLFLVFCWDFKKKKIPNGLIGAGVAAGLLFALTGPLGRKDAASLAAAILPALIRAGTVMGLGSFLWLLRMAGAGDVKLSALIAGWLGMERGVRGLCLGMALGALWSLVRLLRGRELFMRLKQLILYVISCTKEKALRPYERWNQDGEQGVIPLGACLALGTILVIWL